MNPYGILQKGRKVSSTLVLLCALGGWEAHAATDIWTGASNSFLSAGNWAGASTPVSGDSLVFGAAGAGA